MIGTTPDWAMRSSSTRHKRCPPSGRSRCATSTSTRPGSWPFRRSPLSIRPARASRTAMQMDILSDTPRIEASPLQAESIVPALAFGLGLSDKGIEAQVGDDYGSTGATSINSSYQTFLDASQAGVIVIDQSNLTSARLPAPVGRRQGPDHAERHKRADRGRPRWRWRPRTASRPSPGFSSTPIPALRRSNPTTVRTTLRASRFGISARSPPRGRPTDLVDVTGAELERGGRGRGAAPPVRRRDQRERLGNGGSVLQHRPGGHAD